MPLTAFDFSKKQDRRMAIDLLNHLLADAMVSEEYIRLFGKERTERYLTYREKAIRYWLSMHRYLHEIIEEEGEEPPKRPMNCFNLMHALFVHNRDKLHEFLKEEQHFEPLRPFWRKERYGLFHYYDKRSSAESMRKTMRAKVCHENKFTGSDTP